MKSVLKKIFFLYCLFICFGSTIYSQKTEITITGFVTDALTGEELTSVTILLLKDSLNLTAPPYRGTITKNHGFFALPKVTPGIYYLIARSLGFKTFIREVNLTIKNPSLIYNIALNQENIQLPEFTVKGEHEKEINLSKLDISYELMKKLPSLSGELDLFKSLTLLPGIKAASEMSAGLYVRGGSPDQNLTLVDDAILYNPSHLGNFSSTFNSYAVQNIRLIKGAFPAEYGGRLSSVLDIKLRSGTKEKNKGVLGVGIINSFCVLEGPISENSTYIISGRKMYYDFFQNNFNSGSFSPRYNFADLNAKINFIKSESDIFSLSAVYSDDNITNPADNKGIKYDIQWNNTSFTFNWLKINSKSLFINNSISYVNFKTKSILVDNTNGATGSDYFSSSDLQDIFVKSNVELNWNKDNVLKTGIELAFHNYKLIYSDKYDELLETDPYSGTSTTAYEAAMFFQNEWNVYSNLRTNIGGRFYYFRSQKYFRFEPRFSVSYFINDAIYLTGAFSTAHQFLHLILRNDISLPTDLWYPSDSKIEPCKANQYSLGFNANMFDKTFLFCVEGYYKDMENLYEFSPSANYLEGNSIGELFTKGKGEAYGAEVFFNKTEGDFTGWVGYTLSWTRRLFNNLNTGKIFYPRYDRRHDISVVLTFSVSENLTLSSTWCFASGQGYSIPTSQYKFERIGPVNTNDLQLNYAGRNSFKLADYHKLDLSINYTFSWSNVPFETYLTLYNVYNRSNPFAAYISTSGITKNNNNGAVTSINGLTLKQITLFPFTPAFGISVKF